MSENSEFLRDNRSESRVDARRDPQMHRMDDLKIPMNIAQGSVKESQERPGQLEELTRQTKVAREALFEAMKGIGDAVELFTPKSNEYLGQIRQFRMAAVAEFSIALKQFEDVRKFFLSERHDQEIVRLREFVDLCERLQRLKQSGFLDAVAETMLRLEP